MLELDPVLAKRFPERHAFAQWMQLPGEMFRDMPTRKTKRFTYEGQSYFIKQHFGISWKEFFKNVVCGRLPVISAKQEREAVRHLKSQGIETMDVVGFGEKGWGIGKQSFLITKDLNPSYDLEQYCQAYSDKPTFPQEKRALLRRLAKITRAMHASGMNHRDYYLCHFLLKDEKLSPLYLIDCHRALCRQRVSARWKIKDVAGLYFSAMPFGLSTRDKLRFIRYYENKPLHEIFKSQASFWKKVEARALALYRKHF